jgi:hypothetical protein
LSTTGLQQFQRRFVFVGLFVHALLAQHAAGTLVEERQQMHSPLMRRERAAQRLAVDRHGLQFLGRGNCSQHHGQPVANRPLEGLGRDLCQQVAKGVVLRRPPRETQPMPPRHWQRMQPLHDGRIASCAAQQGTNNRGQHGR